MRWKLRIEEEKHGGIQTHDLKLLRLAARCATIRALIKNLPTMLVSILRTRFSFYFPANGFTREAFCVAEIIQNCSKEESFVTKERRKCG